MRRCLSSFENKPQSLSVEDQEVLSKWVTLQSMMTQCGHPTDRQRSIPSSHYKAFYESGLVPVGSQIWVGRYDGSGPWPSQYIHKEFFLARPDSAGPNAYLSAFTIGYAAFVLWGHQVSTGAAIFPTEHMLNFISPIWPATEAVNWPPRGLIGRSGLAFIVDNLFEWS